MDSGTDKPVLLTGSSFTDSRGTVTFNNDFNALPVKRIYTLENSSVELRRGWQGHKIEQRWLASIKGSFNIAVRPVHSLEIKDAGAVEYNFLLTDKALDYLHVPAGYATCIQAIEEDSKLLLLSDHGLGEVQDEWRFEIEQ